MCEGKCLFQSISVKCYNSSLGQAYEDGCMLCIMVALNGSRVRTGDFQWENTFYTLVSVNTNVRILKGK